jgi:glyceraldehyde-3-phosphate dehydrogenase/erythrose-4-phosphate dehydrogenase
LVTALLVKAAIAHKAKAHARHVSSTTVAHAMTHHAHHVTLMHRAHPVATMMSSNPVPTRTWAPKAVSTLLATKTKVVLNASLTQHAPASI